MLQLGPIICSADNCAHGCTPATGCQGIEWRKNHAAQYLRDKGAELIADGAKWGFRITVEIAPGSAVPSGVASGSTTSAQTSNGDTK